MTFAEASVVIPTIGRPDLLRSALASIAECDPGPADLVVVDQSDSGETAEVVHACAMPGARLVTSAGQGTGVAVNVGLEAAEHDTVFIVHDDCTVNSDWIEVGLNAMKEVPDGIVSGQVLPTGDDPRRIPSCLVLAEPRDYTGQVRFGVLFPNNMVCSRSAVLEFGGFDENIPAAEDCDLCYRWLCAGRRLRHVPELIVRHHDWRSPDELVALYSAYYRSQGLFYAKHLRAGDMRVLRFIAGDVKLGLQALGSGVIRNKPRWSDARRGVFAGLPRGLWAGWKTFPRRRGSAT